MCRCLRWLSTPSYVVRRVCRPRDFRSSMSQDTLGSNVFLYLHSFMLPQVCPHMSRLRSSRRVIGCYVSSTETRLTLNNLPKDFPNFPLWGRPNRLLGVSISCADAESAGVFFTAGRVITKIYFCNPSHVLEVPSFSGQIFIVPLASSKFGFG